MSDEPKPVRVFLGAFEGGVHHLTIPAAALAKAEAQLDEARKKREHDAKMETLRTMQAARAQSRLKKAMRAASFWKGRVR